MNVTALSGTTDSRRNATIDHRQLVGPVRERAHGDLLAGAAEETGVDVDDLLHAARPPAVCASPGEGEPPRVGERRGRPREQLVAPAVQVDHNAVPRPEHDVELTSGEVSRVEPGGPPHSHIVAAALPPQRTGSEREQILSNDIKTEETT